MEGCSPIHDPQLRCTFEKGGSFCCIFDATRQLSRFGTSAVIGREMALADEKETAIGVTQ